MTSDHDRIVALERDMLELKAWKRALQLNTLTWMAGANLALTLLVLSVLLFTK
jgi:hypothetical protein